MQISWNAIESNLIWEASKFTA